MTLSLDNPVQGGFDVDVFTDNGTALSGAGNDYTALSQTVSFSGTASENQTVIINVDNDTIAEGNEEFYLRMSNLASTSLSVGISDNGTVKITDDDTTTITMEDNSTVENSGTISVTLTSDKAVQGGFTVDVFTDNGTATTLSLIHISEPTRPY